MAIYILLYCLALSGYVFRVNRKQSSRRAYIIIMFSLLVLFAVLRHYTVGTDLRKFYYKYFPQFAEIPWNQLQSVTKSGDWEIGFCMFNKLLALINPHIQNFIIFSSIVSIVPVAVFIYKNVDDVVFGTSFFCGFHIYSMSMNVVRQAMAVGILIMGFGYLKKKQYFRYILVVFLATSFHTTAIIGVLLVMVDKIKFKRNTIILLSAGLVAITFTFRFMTEQLLQNPYMSSLYGIYSLSGAGDSGGYVTIHTLGMFAITLMFFLMLYYFSCFERIELAESRFSNIGVVNTVRIQACKIKIIANEQRIEWSASFLLYALFLAMLFRFMSFLMNVMSRFSLYFFPFIMVAFSRLCGSPIGQKRRTFLYIFTYFTLTLFFLYIVMFRAESLWGNVPYQFFWE